MHDCFAPETASVARPVHITASDGFDGWLRGQPERWRNWLDATRFQARAGRVSLLPGPDGAPEAALLVANQPLEPWDMAALRKHLAGGTWRLATALASAELRQALLGWALASYRFETYRKKEDNGARPRLACPQGDDARWVETVAGAVALARDLINTPASDLGPAELAQAVEDVARRFAAKCRTIRGEALRDENFPAVYTVGQASVRPPQVIDLTWGSEDAPKLTLVGKGVCFDTGGLDLKTSQNMLLMKKDMGGAAVTLALAQALMALEAPVRLRLLVGAVENSVSGASFRPGDVIRTRKGLTVEIGNTDAEGRLVLCDLLAAADGERPDLLIDCATLTGAARVALGPDLPALFTPDDALADLLLAAGREAIDPLWRLPLHQPYREMLESSIADINNTGSGGLAGAITAALFLKEFVTETRAWAHLDIFAWNQGERPGRPKGGEATALRALIAAVQHRFAT